jgi:nitroimidazol reductase NimA-like FMN-containing flavoprotein (pyridoxamine 5'-phosphate oxidase superfamily)
MKNFSTSLPEQLAIRTVRTLSNGEGRRLFQTARVARIGCVVIAEPYVVPIN